MPVDPTNRHELQRLLGAHHLRLRREESQNFLIDSRTRDALFHAAKLSDSDDVIEIGAGVGTITAALAERVSRVVCVEVDRRLLLILQEVLVGRSNVQIVPGDAKKVALKDLVRLFERLPKGEKSDLAKRRTSEFAPRSTDRFVNRQPPIRYKILSSLPYHLTGFLLKKFMTELPKPVSVTVIIQKEVAERIVARPGAMSLLSVSMQLMSEPYLVTVIPRTAFWPEPAVDSAIVTFRIRLDPAPLLHGAGITERDFFRIVKAGFSARRKQLHNTLCASLRLDEKTVHQALSEAMIAPASRPQELSVEDWIRLSSHLCAKKDN